MRRTGTLRTGTFFALAGLILGLATSANAKSLRFDSFKRGDKEFTILFGGGENLRHFPIAEKSDIRFGSAKLRFGVFTTPSTQLSIDLTTGVDVNHPDRHAIWTTGGYRKYFCIRGNTAFAYDFNFGFMYFNKRLPEQGSLFNFTEQLGLLWQQGLPGDSAFMMEYKFAHISNAGLVLPNIGINMNSLSIGYSKFF